MVDARLSATLSSSASRSANFSQTPTDLKAMLFEVLVITLTVTSADRTNSDETYDVYITTSDGVSTWDIVHFPQVATTGAKTFTARPLRASLPQNITSATPGVAANDPGTLRTDTAGSNNGIRTLAAGLVRNGAWGNLIGHELVVAGTTPGPFVYQIDIQGA
jgi:hypothetical protein